MKSLIVLFCVIVYCNAQAKVSVQPLTPNMGLSEAPHWDPRTQRLYFVVITDNKLCSVNITTKITNCITLSNGPVGAAIPVEGAVNQFVVASGRDILLVTWDGVSNSSTPQFRKLTSIDTDKNDTRSNDGKADSRGRFWIGTMGPENKGLPTLPNRGSLYMIGSDLRPQKKIDGVTVSNGLAWNGEDNMMFYIDSVTLQVFGYNYSADTGAISNKRVIFDIKKNNIKGFPDGMTIDANGNLWVALWSGAKVIQVDPRQGKLLGSVDLPNERVTSVAFGGPQLDTLFVTTSSYGMTAAEIQKQPSVGSVFAVTGLGVKGLEAKMFKMQS